MPDSGLCKWNQMGSWVVSGISRLWTFLCTSFCAHEQEFTVCAHDLKMSIEWKNCWVAQGHSSPLLGKTNACPHSWPQPCMNDSISTHACYYLLLSHLKFTRRVGVRWYLTVVLLYTFPIPNKAKYNFMFKFLLFLPLFLLGFFRCLKKNWFSPHHKKKIFSVCNYVWWWMLIRLIVIIL